jgi:hypothetical protein
LRRDWSPRRRGGASQSPRCAIRGTMTCPTREDALVTNDHNPGLLLIVGSVVFGLGAAIGVPRIFIEADPQARLRRLTEHLGMWRVAQPLYGLGPSWPRPVSAAWPPPRPPEGPGPHSRPPA